MPLPPGGGWSLIRKASGIKAFKAEISEALRTIKEIKNEK
jgi:hypothetical protein